MIPGMFGDYRVWSAGLADDAAPYHRTEPSRGAKEPHLDIADTRHHQLGPEQIKPNQRHNYSAACAASAANSPEQAIQRLIKMLLNILACGLRSLVGKRTMTQSINYPSQSVVLPLPDNNAVAIFLHQAARPRGGAELEMPGAQPRFSRADPALTKYPRPGRTAWMEFHLVHQPVDRPKSRT